MTLPHYLKNRNQSIRNASGLSLIELLIVVIIIGVLSLITGRLLIGQMYATRRIESGLRSDSNGSRFRRLITNEANEAARFELVTTLPSSDPDCGADAGVVASNSAVRFEVPLKDGSYANVDGTTSTSTYYYTKDGNIKRCGLPVFRNGSLDFDSSHQVGVVIRDASIAFDSLSADGKQFNYTINLDDYIASEELLSNQAVRAKSIFVCNPPDPTDCATTGFKPFDGYCGCP